MKAPIHNVKLSKLWDSLRSSYWFLPGLMALGGMALALATLALDQADRVKTGELSWIYTGGPEGARGLLSAVAGSMVTVAATAFSITIVALQLAAANFGPRLLRNFMQDTGNQIVLGTFIATFLYCLLVLRTIRGEDYDLFVPQLSVTVGMGLAIASIGVLIYFIHHASTIIQTSHVIASVAEELDYTIERLFPQEIGQPKQNENQQYLDKIPEDFDAQACSIHSIKAGYLQAIDDRLLMKIVCKYDLMLRFQSQPGDFVARGDILVLAYPKNRVNQVISKQINSTFLLGRERTEQQDIRFPMNQLVEIALRALSPGINDPFTAIRCIDRLGVGLSYLAEREFPSPCRFDSAHQLRFIAEPVTFPVLVDLAFSQIRRYGVSDLVVTIRLMQMISHIAAHATTTEQRDILRCHGEAILRSSQQTLSEERDRAEVEQCYQKVLQALGLGKPQIPGI